MLVLPELLTPGSPSLPHQESPAPCSPSAPTSAAVPAPKMSGERAGEGGLTGAASLAPTRRW